jgi:hypothetical protein
VLPAPGCAAQAAGVAGHEPTPATGYIYAATQTPDHY